MAVISASRLFREYSPGRGVAGVSLSVDSGQCLAILGRNGSGKTTLVRLLLGLERATSGEISILGTRVEHGRRPEKLIGAVLDFDAHFDNLSGFQNAHFFARAQGLSREQAASRLERLFKLAGLWDERHDRVGSYSFGMRRKLSVIEALAHDPELLIMDEPTAGLDPQFMVALAQEIRKRSKAGLTTVISGNDPDWVEGVASVAIFLEKGEIIEQGRVDELIARVRPLREARIIIDEYTEVPPPSFAGLHSFAQDGLSITAVLDPAPVLVSSLIESITSRGIMVKAVDITGGGLKDAFLLKSGRVLKT